MLEYIICMAFVHKWWKVDRNNALICINWKHQMEYFNVRFIFSESNLPKNYEWTRPNQTSAVNSTRCSVARLICGQNFDELSIFLWHRMRKGDVRLAVGITVVGITCLILSFASLVEKDQSESIWSPGDAFLEAGPWETKGKTFSDTLF